MSGAVFQHLLCGEKLLEPLVCEADGPLVFLQHVVCDQGAQHIWQVWRRKQQAVGLQLQGNRRQCSQGVVAGEFEAQRAR